MKNLLILCLFFLVWAGLTPDACACAVATNVQASSPAATTLAVSFTPVPGIGQYVVLLFRGNARTGIQHSAGSAVTFTGLQPATLYSVRVASICGPADTTYAAPVAATTAGSGTCAAVANTAVGPVTSTQATLSFTPVSGAVSYTIWYWATNDSTAVQTLTVTSPPATLSGLRPATRYAVRIVTNCASGGTSSTPATVFQTAAATATACGAVSNVAVTASSDSTATVSFTPGTNNTSFQVMYFTRPDSTVHTVSGSSSPITIAGLVPGHTYYIRVRSQCASSGTTVYTTGSTVYGFRGTSALAGSTALGKGTLAAFPNPAHQSVTVQLPAGAGASAARLTLLNSLGQVVRSQEVVLPAGGAQAEVTLAGVTPGLYTLRLVAGGQAATRRLAVE